MLSDGSAFTRDTQGGMETSLSLGVDACGRGLWDTDAAARIAQIQAAGAVVSSEQRKFLSEWVIAEKASGRWAGIKRFGFPIWGVAAANNICLKTGATIGFLGGTVTHHPGYFKGDGSTGYFQYYDTLGGYGAGANSIVAGTLCYLATTVNNSDLFSAREASGGFRFNALSFNDLLITNGNTNNIFYTSAAERRGIFIGGRTSSTSNYAIYKRTASTQTLIGATNTPSTYQNCYVRVLCGAFQYQDAAAFSNAGIGAHFISAGFDLTNGLEFANNLKTLWEGCTGLTLP